MRARRWAVVWLLMLATICGCTGLGYGQTQTASGDDTEVVATINGQRKIMLKEVDALAGPELQGLLDRINTLRWRALNNLITRALLEDEARARGLTIEELNKQLVPERVEVEQKAVDDLYLANANRYASLSEDEVKQRIKLDLENRAKFEEFQKALARIRSKAKVEIYLREPVGPTVKVSDTGPSKGASSAPVTIIEFADFQCPFCKEASNTLKQLLASYGSNVRLIFKHMPLSKHPNFLGDISVPIRIGVAEKEAFVSLSLESGISVAGEVRDESGNTVQGAQVRLIEVGSKCAIPGFTSHELLKQQIRYTVSEANGTFSFEQVRPTKKMLVVIHPGYKPFKQMVELAPSQAQTPVRIVLMVKK